MTIPAIRDWSATEIVTEAKLDEISAALNFLMEPPRVYAYHTAGSALTDGAWTVISLGAELYDWTPTAMHDTVTNNSRVHARETGLHTIHNQIRTSDLSGTICQFQVRKNAVGSDTGGIRVFLQSQDGAGGGEVTELGRSVDYPLTNGDYVELFVRVNTGANPNASLGAGADATFLSIRWGAKT